MARIYADYNATYPVTQYHWDQVGKVLLGAGANASAIHAHGRAARSAVEKARAAFAKLLGCSPKHITFLSSATEANNMLLRSVFAQKGNSRLLISRGEHGSVYKTALWLTEQGFCHLDFAPLTRQGEVDQDGLLELK